ncbi:amino acid-binding protein [Gordonia sp. X0973]|uniref:amino acid-binding protein n=1 Tax=Gordonia sp. X0973 TaxID=2742602 RepID=UPI000F548EDE|nr:amino acid-binding protein [Gordonia sp. X0973]QKT07801.1 amino acid-binding protein [Gordonia sp. X0973]
MARVSYLLRVTIDDRPGSLGQLAVALGGVGADIISLEVIERGSGWAVDDIVVDLPLGALPDTLITAAATADAHVDSVRPYAGVLDTHRELELVDHVATAKADRLQTLVDDAPQVLRASWATVVTKADSGATVTVCGSSGAPETPLADASWLPMAAAATIDPQDPGVPQMWRDWDTRLVAAPLDGPHRALLLGRVGGPDFRPAEVARLGYLIGIISSLSR